MSKNNSDKSGQQDQTQQDAAQQEAVQQEQQTEQQPTGGVTEEPLKAGDGDGPLVFDGVRTVQEPNKEQQPVSIEPNASVQEQPAPGTTGQTGS